MADNKTPRDERQKSYYSLNLTEGRRFMIFIVFIIVLAVLLIGVWLVVNSFSKNSRTVNNESKKTENTLAYYYSLTNQDVPKSVTDSSNDTKGDGSEPSLFDNKTIVQTKVDTSADKVIEEPMSNADDSEILYTSKFKTADDENKSVTTLKNKTSAVNKSVNTKTTKKTTEPVKKTKTVVKADVKKAAKKYVVQIGSYTNKKTADEIASFYQNNGNYPTFVKDTVTNGKTFYRLRVGPFTDKTRAEQFLTYLKDTKYGKNCYISEIYN